MTMKLVQKQFLKGRREFEIQDDTVFVCMKSLFKEEKLTVSLSSLDPEPVIKGSELLFYSPYKGRPVLSLLLNKPSTGKFNAFVDTLKQGILNNNNASTSSETTTPESVRREALNRNVYEEPPEFAEPGKKRDRASFKPVNAERLSDDISMLKTYLVEDDIKTLLDSLEALKAEPQNEIAFQKVLDDFNQLGIEQGAVLTYAHYLKALISESM